MRNEPLLKLLLMPESVGSFVRFWPAWQRRQQKNYYDTKTTGRAFQNKGVWMVAVERRRDGVPVDHCALLPLEERGGPMYDPGAR